MSDFISREDAKLHIFEYGVRHRDNSSIAAACEILELQMNAIPAADVRPVARGKWIERRFLENVYGAECSVCHTTWDYGTIFCPNCGAEMRSTNCTQTTTADEEREVLNVRAWLRNGAGMEAGEKREES